MSPNRISFYCLFVSVVIFISMLSCVTTARPVKIQKSEDDNYIQIGRENEKIQRYNYDTKDVEPLELKFEAFKPVPMKNANSAEFVSSYNRSVEQIEKKDYASAIDILLSLAKEYDDKGRSLYNLGICYRSMNDFSNALKYFAYSYGAGFPSSAAAIDSTIFQTAYNHMMNRRFEEAIGYYKNCAGSENANRNILYSYIELAKTYQFPGNLEMLLHAGNYSVMNEIKDKNILGIAKELNDLMFDDAQPEYLANAIEVMRFIARETGDEAVRQALAMFCLYNGDIDDAKKEFLALAQKSGDKEISEFANAKAIELERILYRYSRMFPFTIESGTGDPDEVSLEITSSIPQNNSHQTTTAIEVSVNGKPVDYEIIKDKYGAQFIKSNPGKNIRPGENKLLITAVVEREARRYRKEKAAGFKIADYSKTPRFKLYTQSTHIYDVSHPVVKKAREKLMKAANSGNLLETVRAVYDYVINEMKYDMYEVEKRPKKEILGRLQKSDYSGVCEDYAVLTVTLLRSYGIPCIVLSGPMHNQEIGHAWPAFFLPSDPDDPIVIDSTWGDTSSMPNYYFLFNSNLTVIERFEWDSDVLPEGQSTSFRVSSNIKVKSKKETVSIVRM